MCVVGHIESTMKNQMLCLCVESLTMTMGALYGESALTDQWCVGTQFHGQWCDFLKWSETLGQY